MSGDKHSPPPGCSAEIEGFPGYYVTRDGGVWSTWSWRGSFTRRLSTYPDQDGYPFVRLMADGKRKIKRVHRLVAAAFLPPKPFPEAQIRHIDGVPAHCSAENLEWGSNQDNVDDRERHGRTSRGASHSVAIKRGLDVSNG